MSKIGRQLDAETWKSGPRHDEASLQVIQGLKGIAEEVYGTDHLAQRFKLLDEVEPGLWALSYVNEGSGVFNGLVLINAPNFIAASMLARLGGLTPGGQVMGSLCDPSEIPVDLIGRVLTEQDVREKLCWKSKGEYDTERQAEEAA